MGEDSPAGSVSIGDRVEIGAGCAIDRGALDNTVIEDDVIIDNLVHIAHGVTIGARSAVRGRLGLQVAQSWASVAQSAVKRVLPATLRLPTMFI